MSNQTPAPAPAKQRDHYLDWIIGIACLFMLGIHATILSGMPHRHWLWTAHLEVIHQFYAWFFVASGMNVYRAARRDFNKPGWRPYANYLLGALALFVLGIMYSVNRRTFGQMELFQGIAACTAVTYLIARRNWPNWALLTISVLLFGVSIDYAYMYWDYPHYDVFMKHADMLGRREFKVLIDQIVGQFGLGERFLFVHFSLIPWVSWFLMGVVLMRWVGTQYEKVLWIFFAACLLVSFYPPEYVPKVSLDFYLRAKIDFLFRSTAMAGLSILAAHRWYKGTKKINKTIEFIGKESLMIFILQWFIVDFGAIPLNVLTEKTGEKWWLLFPLLQAATIYFTYRFTKYMVAKRNATIMNKGYLKKWLTITLVFFVLSLTFYTRRVGLSYLLSFPIIVGVAMAFPAVRLAIRNALKPKKKPEKQAEAEPTAS